ncbi:MAG: permease [Thalassobaculum sp.]
MADMALTTRRFADRIDWTVFVVLAAFVALALFSADQAGASAIFVGDALLGVAPFLFASIAIAAYAKASGADSLIARAFEGREVTMIGAAALMGALSPFCSCGVIPLIAALLSMGVPLAPVMAFWLASPLMDPSMFFLTAGTLGMDFALFKVAAAVAVGLIGGFGPSRWSAPAGSRTRCARVWATAAAAPPASAHRKRSCGSSGARRAGVSGSPRTPGRIRCSSASGWRSPSSLRA